MKNKNIFKKVITDYSVQSKEILFEVIAKYAVEKNIVNDYSLLLDDFYRRELIGSTLIEESLALPHIQSPTIKNSALIYIRLSMPIKNWDKNETQVYGVFFILVKEHETSKNLNTIRKIIRSLAEEEVLELLLNAEDKVIEKIIKKFEGE
jgi:PTS system fructose-specific IIA component